MDISEKIISGLIKATGSQDIKLDTPVISTHGDYATNIALLEAKRQNKTPHEVASDIITILQTNKDMRSLVDEYKVAGPGFINIFLKDRAIAETMKEILNDHDRTISVQNKMKVVVEYSSPNIAKPFGIGHFRSTIIGDAIANLLSAVGHKVYRDNHLGDWGTQFGKLVYAIKTWGDMQKIEQSDNPVMELVGLYVRFHEEADKNPKVNDYGREWFRKLENGDPEARELWQKCVDLSMKEFMRIYEILGIRFTENDAKGYGESYFEHMMPVVIQELRNMKLLKEGVEGAQIVEFDKGLPPLMIIKKDGSTLYATRDLATDKFRLEKYGQDTVIINEVGAEQSLYFEQLFELERMLGWVKAGQRIHIKHGLFRFKGKKMSTRKGNIILLSDVISEAVARAKKFDGEKELAEKVAIGALKWNELKRDPVKDVNFDWDELLSMEGNSGPYMQYTYARINSIFSKGEVELPEYTWGERALQIDEIVFDDNEKALVSKIVKYPEITKYAAKNYSPHILANYLYSVASEFNSFYATSRIVGDRREKERLFIASTTGKIIQNGLHILGIQVVDKM